MIAVHLALSAVIVAAATAVLVTHRLGAPLVTVDSPLALALTLLSIAYCAQLFFFEYRRGRLFSPLSLYAALVGIHFAIPGLLLSLGWMRFVYDLNVPYFADCLYFVVLCLAAFQMGSFFAWRFGKTPENERHDHLVIWSDRRLLFAVAIIAMAGWMARLYVIAVGAYFQLDRTTVEISTLGALLVFLEQLPFYAYVLLLVGYYYRARLLTASRSWLCGVIAIGAAEFIYWIGAGRKLETILVLVLALVARYLANCKLPSLKVIGLGALIVLLIFPVTFYYRYSLETSFGLGTDIASIPQVIEQATTVTEDAGPALDIILNRFNLTESVSAAMRLAETEEWGLLGGSSYLDIFLILIPRFLWSSKPDYHYGTEFGHASGLSALSDQLTSISVTYFGEAFLNLMWFGCLVFLVLGFLAEKLYLYASRNTDAKWLFLYCLSLPPLMYVGGTAALNFGGLIRLLIVFYVFASLLSVYRISVLFARRVLQPTPKYFPN